MHPVNIQNDSFSLDVWPHIGGKVSSLIDKADHYQLLFSIPGEIPESPSYDVDYSDHWYTGWDECFPAVAPSLYPGHPYARTAVPDHGELWGIPTTTAVPTKNGITTVWNGLRFGYRLTRKLHLENSSVIAEYTLNNLAPFEFHFVWALHSLMSVISPVELVNPAGGKFRMSHDAEGNDLSSIFNWPTTDAGETFSHPDGLPPRKGWKMFSHDPISGPMIVHYPKRQRALKIEFKSNDGMNAYWGIWINTGGWAGNRHFALEPTTGRFDQIDRAVKDGSAGSVGPFAQKSWTVTFTTAPL